jgi:beta-lactamase regulating signal transducer with metallopeptidase domain
MNTMTWLQNGAAWAWHTSLVMAVPALILLALGCWRGFSPRWRMLLAGVLFFRLLLPTVPELPGRPTWSVEKTLPVAAAPVVAHAVMDAPLPTVSNLGRPSDTNATRLAMSWLEIEAGVWVLGVLAVAAWVAASQMMLRRWITRQAVAPDAKVLRLFRECCERMRVERHIRLVELPRISTAAVWGWLRPVVLVSANLTETHTPDEIRGILLHELAHVRRNDVLWSWFGLAACALHWFNPLAWLTLRRFHTDRELDCDRIALENLTAPQRSAYAPALFKTLQAPVFATSAALVPFFRTRHEIHNRILTIMKPAKSLAATLAALLVIPAVSLLSLTKASADGEKPASAEGAAKTGDGEQARTGPRDGEAKKSGIRDGEAKKTGPRDGEVKKEGARDGEARKTGARDGEGARKTGARDGEGSRKGARDGDAAKKSGEVATDGKAVTLRVLGTGDEVSINGEKIATSGLRGYLSQHLTAGSSVIVQAEETVPWGAVMNVVDAARDNGAKGTKIDARESNREGDGKARTAEGR